MNLKHQNHHSANFFKENRLVFLEVDSGDKTPEELAQQGGKEWRQFKRKVRKEWREEKREKRQEKREENKEERAKTIHERRVKRRMEWLRRWEVETIKAKTKSELQKLHEELDRAQEKRDLAGYHTERRDSRDDLEIRKPVNEESLRAARRAIETKGVMSLEEIKRMDAAQSIISSHYMNPAFMLYMNTLKEREPLGSEEVYKAFDAILTNPYAFEYLIDDVDESVTVKKRKVAEFKDVPEVSMKFAQKGFVEEINGKKLTNPKGELPWEGINYQKNMADYRQRFDYEWAQNVYPQFYAGPYRQNLDEATRNEIYRKMQYEAFKEVTPIMRELYALHHIQIPNTFLNLVDARKADFEQNDPQVKLLRAAMKQQGKTYEEITQQRDQKLKIMVLTIPEYPEAYVIRFRDNPDQKLVIHKTGYIMKETSPGVFQIDPRYGAELKQNYFKAEAAKGLDVKALNEIFELKEEMQKRGSTPEAVQEAADRIQYMRPVEVALSKATWEHYKQIVAQILSPNDPNVNQTLDAYAAYFVGNPAYQQQVQNFIAEAIIKRMKNDKSITDRVAQILGVQLNP